MLRTALCYLLCVLVELPVLDNLLLVNFIVIIIIPCRVNYAMVSVSPTLGNVDNQKSYNSCHGDHVVVSGCHGTTCLHLVAMGSRAGLWLPWAPAFGLWRDTSVW